MFDTFLLDLIFDALVFGFMSWRYSLALSQFSGALHVLDWFNLVWFEKFDRLCWQGKDLKFVSTSYHLNAPSPFVTLKIIFKNLHHGFVLGVKPAGWYTNYKGTDLGSRSHYISHTGSDTSLYSLGYPHIS